LLLSFVLIAFAAMIAHVAH